MENGCHAREERSIVAQLAVEPFEPVVTQITEPEEPGEGGTSGR